MEEVMDVKEIEEMAKIVCKEKACSLEYCNKVEKYPNRYMCLTRNGLKALYNAGYGKIEDYKREIEKLKSIIAMAKQHYEPDLPFEDEYDNAIKEARQQAIKEFAERLKTQMGQGVNTDNEDIYGFIDDLLKEYGVGE